MSRSNESQIDSTQLSAPIMSPMSIFKDAGFFFCKDAGKGCNQQELQYTGILKSYGK